MTGAGKLGKNHLTTPRSLWTHFVRRASHLEWATPGVRRYKILGESSAADRAARHRKKYDPLIAISALVSSARILARMRPSCGLSRRPGSRDPGISVGRKRHSEPSPAHFAQLANLALPGWRPSPHRATGHRSAFRKRGQLFAIFDPGSIFRLAEELFPGQGAALSTAWRVRQFEYTWLRNSMHQYKDFYGVTQDALIFASKQTRIELHPEQMGRLAFGGQAFGGQTGLVLTASAGQSVALIQPHPGVRFRSLEESMRQTDWYFRKVPFPSDA